MTTATLVAGSLLLSVGCGSTQADPGARGPDSADTTTVGSDEPVTSSDGTLKPKPKAKPSPVRPKGHTVDPRPIPWISAKADDGNLRLVWWSGVEPCHTLDRVSVRETAGQVKVTLYEGASEKAQNVACIEIAVQKTTTVKLKAPLGDRKVVDGAK
ncbi:hypothetical protein [Streptosporangium sp. KLBMP 9127]|nr:hypothetical protein [Streptosporangium sp. KLBMP 9127]